MNIKFICGIFVLQSSAKPSISFVTNSALLNPKKERFVHELHGITKSKTAILDGSSLNALDLFLSSEGLSTGEKLSSLSRRNNQHGYCNIIAAKLPNNERIVGIKVDSNMNDSSNTLEKMLIDGGVEVYKDSVAKIPNAISDDDAISTCIGSFLVHCALHDPMYPDDKIVRNVGGSSVEFVSDVEAPDKSKRKAVVVGGGDYASFVAE